MLYTNVIVTTETFYLFIYLLQTLLLRRFSYRILAYGCGIQNAATKLFKCNATNLVLKFVFSIYI
jgi:hypothetical protein